MTQLVVEQAPLVVKIRDVLRAAGIRSEVAKPPAPVEGEKVPRLPYVIVYSIDGGEFMGGPLESPDSCATMVVQVTAVGATGVQASKVADKARRTLLGRATAGYVTNLDFEGQRVTGRESNGTGGHDPESLLVSLPERYTFFVNAA